MTSAAAVGAASDAAPHSRWRNPCHGVTCLRISNASYAKRHAVMRASGGAIGERAERRTALTAIERYTAADTKLIHSEACKSASILRDSAREHQPEKEAARRALDLRAMSA